MSETSAAGRHKQAELARKHRRVREVVLPGASEQNAFRTCGDHSKMSPTIASFLPLRARASFATSNATALLAGCNHTSRVSGERQGGTRGFDILILRALRRGGWAPSISWAAFAPAPPELNLEFPSPVPNASAPGRLHPAGPLRLLHGLSPGRHP